MNKFLAKMKNEEGQALAEYGLLVALIAVICVAAVTAIGTSVSTKLLSIATSI
jgi:pilus assembly protein Flp/PilA